MIHIENNYIISLSSTNSSIWVKLKLKINKYDT